jgi:hypothetical protein
MATFGEILAHFKKAASNEPENIVPLMQDDGLINGLISWKSVVIKYGEAGGCPHQEESRMWQWLWENIDFDASAFAAVAGVRVQDVSSLLTRLRGLRLIYPDGTINEIAKQYLQSLIANKIRSSMRGLPKVKPDPKIPELPVKA